MRVVLQKTYCYHYFVLLLFFLGVSPLIAQNELEQDTAFFNATLADYQEWLDATQLSNLLIVKSLNISSDALLLQMEIKTREDWFDLRDIYKEKFDRNIGEDLLKKLAFQMELGKDSIVIIINTPTLTYPIKITYAEGEYATAENEPLLSTKGMFIIKLEDIPKISSDKTVGSAEEVKQIIKSYFRAYYKDKGAWGKTTRYRVIDNGEELSIEVSDMTKEVLDDFLIGYFEFVQIEMYIEQKGEVVEVTYELQAKYGSGVFVAPRRSGYKDMEPRYGEYVEQYRKKFKSMMNEILRAQKIKG